MSPMWVQGTRHLGHLSLLAQVHQQGAGAKVPQPGLELVPMWDAAAPGGGLTHCTTTLAPLNRPFDWAIGRVF